MPSYGLDQVRFFPNNESGVDVGGGISFQEESTAPTIDKIYSDGELVNVTTGDVKEFHGKLTLYSKPELFDAPTTLTYCFIKHGRRAMAVMLNSEMFYLDESYETVADTVTPSTFAIDVYPMPMRVSGRLVSHMSIEERLVGTHNFDRLHRALYGQNGSVSNFLDVLQNGMLETRRFRVIYDREGVWEISGPDNLIRNHASGEWEIDEINHVELGNGEYILIDDYEEDPVWLP